MAELKMRRSENVYLPDEILSNILLRLPVKHILRFKTVCKSWQALITSHDFAKLHRNHSKQFPCHEDGALVFKGKNDKSLYVVSLDSIPQYKAVKLDLEGLDYIEEIISCCNDLLLCRLKLGMGRTRHVGLFLVNPSTLEVKRLPVLPLLKHHRTIGFGYDHITDDYKIVVIVVDVKNKDNGNYMDEMFIYSSKADSWSKFTDDMPVIRSRFSSRSGVLMNNHLLHWYNLYYAHRVIVSFDVSTEKWNEVPSPESTENIMVTELDVQNGLLCISGHLGSSYFGNEIVWVMKEYGVKDSWTELLNKTLQLGVQCHKWRIAPIANHAQGDRDEMWLMKLISGNTGSKIKWYAIGKKKQTPTFQFPCTLADYDYTACTRSLVTLKEFSS